MNQKTTIFNQKTKAAIFTCFLISGLFFVSLKSAQAIWGVGDIGLLDLANIQLDALDFVDAILTKFIYPFLMYLLFSQAFVLAAGTLLQWAISLQVTLSNTLVMAGYDFILGLVNIAFLLLFVVIALALILKFETFEMKKALPRLVIIALLVNFSLVFVGIIVDIGQISFNTIKTAMGVENFIEPSIMLLKDSSLSIAAWFTATITAYTVVALVPYYNVYALLAIAGVFLVDLATPLFGGIMLKAVFLMFLNILMGTIYFLYFVLFMARIIVIWLLAMFSPIAFFAFILPNTKKYFDQWLHYLISWSFLGVVTFFLLGLGLKLFSITGEGQLLAWVDTDTSTTSGAMPPFIYNYLFLAVYLSIVLYVAKKFVPAGADVIIKTSTGLVSKSAVLARPLLSNIGRRIATTERGAAATERLEGWQIAKTPNTIRGKLFTPFKRGVANRVLREVGQGVSIGRIDRAKELASKSQTPNDLIYSMTQTGATKETEIAGMVVAKEKGWMEHVWKRFSKEKLVEIGKNALSLNPELFKKDLRIPLAASLVKIAEGMPENLKNRGGLVLDKNSDKDTQIKKALAEAKTEDVKNMDLSLLFKSLISGSDDEKSDDEKTVKDIEEAIHLFWKGPQIAAAADKFGNKFVDFYQKGAEERGIDWYFKTDETTSRMRNSSGPSYLQSTPAMVLGLRPLKGGETPQKIGKLLAKGRIYQQFPMIKKYEKDLEEIKISENILKGARSEDEGRKVRERIEELQKSIEEIQRRPDFSKIKP
ncbi:MAG: hypothetical protein Q7T34_00600, partial [Candidatus Parcubacteria bacterium]|nr:hypothetical protein [Candidatus Parcubacteria bacterium]